MPTPDGQHTEREWLEGLRYDDKFPTVTDEMIERGARALTMFVFPGAVVPRREMAEAVLYAVSHHDDPRIGLAQTVVRISPASREDQANG